MQHRFTSPKANITIHVDGRLLLCEQVNRQALSITGASPKTEHKKNNSRTANGMRDDARILSNLTQEHQPMFGEAQKINNRSGGNMLSTIQEHQHSRIPEPSETLPL